MILSGIYILLLKQSIPCQLLSSS